jgi:DNA-binding response OmpR family regulator
MVNVLVVADAEWVVNDVRSVLIDPKCVIDTLEDPRHALARVLDAAPDVVIVDLQVGSMGGMAVVRDLAAGTDEEERPRLVMLLDREADVFLAKRAGADAAVVKPFDADELRTAIDTS